MTEEGLKIDLLSEGLVYLSLSADFKSYILKSDENKINLKQLLFRFTSKSSKLSGKGYTKISNQQSQDEEQHKAENDITKGSLQEKEDVIDHRSNWQEQSQVLAQLNQGNASGVTSSLIFSLLNLTRSEDYDMIPSFTYSRKEKLKELDMSYYQLKELQKLSYYTRLFF